MSFEIDCLSRRIHNLEFLKADSYKIDELKNLFNRLQEKITSLENELSYYKERLDNVESKTSDIPFNGED